ncbi:MULTISPECIES: hypothetical protein [Dyella]|uniref:Uncharacterized protein n=2 Tax=Dyella TaxID=231454 RepID=A0A4R0Z054_9GAMM|nr:MULTISPECIES: hypothetical protein [Dyella]TBR39943.1 hypothetical protein EYV96_07100 [Dyella terrae]TCI12476.1 hypothetical protein EZM97_03770 [Dyella soli]
MVTLYLILLFIGVISFVMHFFAQARIASLMRTRHADHWKIIAERDGIKLSPLRIWVNLQAALRSPILPALEDVAITRWRRVWRYCPWLAWLCWFAAIGLQWKAH